MTSLANHVYFLPIFPYKISGHDLAINNEHHSTPLLPQGICRWFSHLGDFIQWTSFRVSDNQPRCHPNSPCAFGSAGLCEDQHDEQRIGPVQAAPRPRMSG